MFNDGTKIFQNANTYQHVCISHFLRGVWYCSTCTNTTTPPPKKNSQHNTRFTTPSAQDDDLRRLTHTRRTSHAIQARQDVTKYYNTNIWRCLHRFDDNFYYKTIISLGANRLGEGGSIQKIQTQRQPPKGQRVSVEQWVSYVLR